MVKNREELLAVSQQNASQLKSHLRAAINGFMRKRNVSAQQLAHVLGIDMSEMDEILVGNGNVTLDTISKLLVATNNVVEIKPVGASPLHSYGPGMPRSGGYPVPPFGRDGHPMMPPPPPGFFGEDGPFGTNTPMPDHENPNDEEVPMETQAQQPRDSRGRYMPRHSATARHQGARRPQRTAAPAPQRRPATVNQYLDVPTEELINIIRQNLWDGEIDINNASREQLAEFVNEKERLLRQRQEEHEQTSTAQEAPQGSNKNESTVNDFLQMLANMAQEARNNPELVDTISRFMPRH